MKPTRKSLLAWIDDFTKKMDGMLREEIRKAMQEAWPDVDLDPEDDREEE
jgi:hypothetical protein